MDELLIRGGHVLTMDASLGDLADGDIHIRDGKIVEVGRALDAPGAEVLNAAGKLVLPGLIDGHRHVWQSLLRGCASDWSFPRYMIEARTMYCGCFDADAAYLANYLGGLESINAGVTSVVDHCHLQTSPEISEALARGLKESGVGGVFCYALQNVPSYLGQEDVDAQAVKDLLLRDPDPWHDANAARLRDTVFNDGPLRFGVALPETAPYVSTEHSAALLARARALEPALITGHWNASLRDGAYSATHALVECGAFARPTLLSHNNLASDDDLRDLARAGVGLCTCPDIEAGMGLGRLMARHYVELGGEACLGLDITSFTGADMFAQARMLLQLERKQMADEAGAMPFEIGYPTRAVLELLTSGGARAIGRSEEIGSLTPGKQADILIVGPNPVHTAPAADPASTLLFYTAPSDVETVLVAGKTLKRGGRLVGIRATELQQAAMAAFSRIRSRYQRLPRADLEAVWAGIF